MAAGFNPNPSEPEAFLNQSTLSPYLLPQLFVESLLQPYRASGNKRILYLDIPLWVTLGKSLHLHEPQFPPL